MNFPFDQGDMFMRVNIGPVGNSMKLPAERTGDIRLGDPVNERLGPQAIGHQVGQADDLELVLIGQGFEIGLAGQVAVFAQNRTQGCGRG